MGITIEEYRNILQMENGYKKSVKRQLQGRINHELGKNFEDQIESICEVYKLNNLAIIEKTPEPMKVLKHIENGHFETIFTKSAQPDFKGIIKGGQTVVFDAKFTEADKITYQALSEYQREALTNYKGFGAMSFVLVGFFDGSMYRVDIETWNNMKEIFGRKHIKKEELENMSIRAKRAKNGIIDFLGIL